MEEKTIAPIQTYYNGYHFRSRLEARWAVFFDLVNIKYEYETEGYTLPNGDQYLPDFYLPTFQTYVEIKHANLGDEDLTAAKEKCEQLSYVLDAFVMLIMGDPFDCSCNLYCSCYAASGVDKDWYCCKFISEYETDIKLSVQIPGCENKKGAFYYSDGSRLEPLTNYYYTANDMVRPSFETVTTYDFSSERQLARQARFEHNQTPQGPKDKEFNLSELTSENITKLSPEQLALLSKSWAINKADFDYDRDKIEIERQRINKEIFRLIPEACSYTPVGVFPTWTWDYHYDKITFPIFKLRNIYNGRVRESSDLREVIKFFKYGKL